MRVRGRVGDWVLFVRVPHAACGTGLIGTVFGDFTSLPRDLGVTKNLTRNRGCDIIYIGGEYELGTNRRISRICGIYGRASPIYTNREV